MESSSFNNRIAYSPIIIERSYRRYGRRGNDVMARPAGAGDEAGEAGAAPARDHVRRPGDLARSPRPQRR